MDLFERKELGLFSTKWKVKVEIFTSTCFSCLSSNYSVSLSVLVDLRGWGNSREVLAKTWIAAGQVKRQRVPTEPVMSVFKANSLYLSIERFNQQFESIEAALKLTDVANCSSSILAVTPQYLWTVQKISNSRIHGSNRIASHGNVKPVDGGLQLNGVDSWLDAGDFYGQCLGDPDLCIKGFSYALQV